jgi:hypothetical protein
MVEQLEWESELDSVLLADGWSPSQVCAPCGVYSLISRKVGRLGSSLEQSGSGDQG